MKKIISIIAVVAILFAFSIAVSAATCEMTMQSGELSVQDGKQEIVLNVVFTLDEETDTVGYCLPFELPTGVSLSAVDHSAFDAILTAAGYSADSSMQDLEVGNVQYYESTYENTVKVTSLTIPCTFEVDTSSATTYTIGFVTDNDPGLLDADWSPMNASTPTATITVKGNDPVVTYEDKDFVTRVEANTSDIELNGQKYTNVAKYYGAINLATVKALYTGEGEKINEAGIMLDGAKKYKFPSIDGDGIVDYTVLFWGITPAEAANVNISTYYNAHVIVAE